MFGSQNGISADNMRFSYSESKGGISGIKGINNGSDRIGFVS